MGKILVGRDERREVEVGFTLMTTPVVEQKEVADAEEKEELAEKAVEDVQVDASETDDVPEKAPTVVKGRGKKGRKA